MGHAKGKDTLLRQWQLLRLIPSKAPGKTVAVLLEALSNEGFIVTRRTVERDLATLSEPFKLTCNDKGTPQGWHYSSGTNLSLPDLTARTRCRCVCWRNT